jgi:hypothetical protein
MGPNDHQTLVYTHAHAVAWSFRPTPPPLPTKQKQKQKQKQALLVGVCYFAAGHIHLLGSVRLPFALDGGKRGMDVETRTLAIAVHVRACALLSGPCSRLE